MTDLETIDRFVELFQGRTDAWGTWDGGSVKYDGWSIHTPLALHLQQGPFVGVYPVTDDNTTGWGCIDIDGKDHPDPDSFDSNWDEMWRIAGELQDVLAYKGVTAWLERTKHGIHVWVFAAERVAASIMRNALLVSCEVANYKPKEVNPKQTAVTAEKPLGNYVRLAYPGGLRQQPTDRFVIDEARPLTVQEFCQQAITARTPAKTLEEMAALWVPPAPRGGLDLGASTEEDFLVLLPILPMVVRKMLDEGALGDRSGTLVRAAKIMASEGFKAQPVLTVLRALDDRLGKFVGRVDRDARLIEIVEAVGL